MINHIAIIPDGNRRWSKEKGLNPLEGHRYAVEKTLPPLYDTMLELNIPYCTFWAMSPENFHKRSKLEIDNLFRLLRHFIDYQLEDLHSKGVRIKIIGNLSELPSSVKKHLEKSIEKTKNNTRMTFIFAMNYGGRDEIIRGVQEMLKANLSAEKLTKDTFGSYLDTKDIPDPDMIIRSGGERRTSGFLLWQSEYTEYFFLDKYFPDCSPEDLKNCIKEYEERQRRFGK
jgi:undecaprenyl diphosphate synthase